MTASILDLCPGGLLLQEPVTVLSDKDWSPFAAQLYESLTGPQRAVWDSTKSTASLVL